MWHLRGADGTSIDSLDVTFTGRGNFVTHDIGAAVEVAARIAVMYAGRIVELADPRTLIRQARHPYTQTLLKGRAGNDQQAMTRGSRLETIVGTPPTRLRYPPAAPSRPAVPWPATHAGPATSVR